MIHVPNNNTPIQLEDKVNIVCEMGKKLVVVVEEEAPKSNRKKVPSFQAIGNGMKTREYVSLPYEDILLELTAPEQRLFKIIRRNYNTNTGYSPVDLSELPRAERNTMSLAYKKLKERNLVKRVKKGIYLINPLGLIHFTLADDLIKVWDSL